MQLGKARLEIVSDGSFWLDAGGHFGLVPKVMWEKVATADEQNRVELALNCLYIESSGTRILVDTGLGSKLDARHREIYKRSEGDGLLGSLAKIGVSPEDIDIVLNTHLHSDHCGGDTRKEGGRTVLSFPRAEYWVQGEEWEDALRPNERTQATYLAENFVPVQEAGRFRFLEGDTPVTDEVRCGLSPGHTRAHQSIVIESGGQAAIYLADLSPWAVHFERLAWIPAYDLQPLVTLETKRSVREWAQRTNALLFFEHDPRVTAGYLRPADKEFIVEPLALRPTPIGRDSALE